jgi:Reverse transcriptase (RNA-dependent DNA polymerase)
MSQPSGFTDFSLPNHVCLLKKALYDLKQTSRAWFHKLASSLSTLGFKASQSDSSLFICGDSTSLILVLVYVDDIVITSSNSSLVTSLGSQFFSKI